MDVVVLGYRECIGSAFLGPYDMLTMSFRMLAKPGDLCRLRSLPRASTARVSMTETEGGRR